MSPRTDVGPHVRIRDVSQGRQLRCLGAGAPPHEAWIELLSRYEPWDWFVTVTWPPGAPRLGMAPRALGPEARMSNWRYWVGELNRRGDGLGLGRNWRQHANRTRWALAWEPHRSGAMHGHALVSAPELPSVKRVLWKERWYEYNGGIARVYEPIRGRSVQAYCTKYVTKGGEIELSDNVAEVQARVTQHRLSSRSQPRRKCRPGAALPADSPA